LIKNVVKNQVSVSLANYLPYHSKYNPLERVGAVLENHWKGEMLDSVEKVLGIARNMKYNGKNSVVKLINSTNEKVIKLIQKDRKQLEKMIAKITGIEKWAGDILCFVNE
jgi:Rhodopirellula transposase DDE domain